MNHQDEDTRPPWMIADQVSRIDERLKAVERKQEDFVTKDEHWVTKAISIGLAALTLSSVLAVVLARVLGR
jgi:hypothetical protein